MSRSTDLSSRNVLRTKPFSHPASKVTGPFSFLNPTSAQLHPQSLSPGIGSKTSSPQHAVSGQQPHQQAAIQWSSRDNRKGRHALVITPSLDASSTPTPPRSSSLGEIGRGIWRMCTEYPYWDVSWLVATIFTWGSVVWVINGSFAWLPLQVPSTSFSTESLYGGGITAFIGATIFVLGSILLMIEAVNENRADCFGWALEEAIEGGNKHQHPQNTAMNQEKMTSTDPVIVRTHCRHHHANRRNFVGKGPLPPTSSTAKGPVSNTVDSSDDEATLDDSKDQTLDTKRRSWVWWPTMQELRVHYIHEIGFLACSAQMIGATIFWIAGLTALPGIQNKLSRGALIGVYWVPQIVGGCGFIISGALFMLETQKKWYIPALDTLGWHIGLYNFIGGVGFMLCPCFGIDTQSWAQYEASLTTYWASWFFLIGSVIQWYESQSKAPVSVGKIEGPVSPTSGGFPDIEDL